MIIKLKNVSCFDLLKAFKYADLSDSGFANPEKFLRTLTKLGINIVNKENVLDYFYLYDKDKTGRINYRDFITEIFTPQEMRRKEMIEEEPNKEENKQNNQEEKKEKRRYNLKSTGYRQRIEQNLDKNSKIIKKLKKEILSQGSDIIFNIIKTLMKFDVENNGRIDSDEFSRLCYEYNINLTPDEIKIIFSCFDPSRIGKIYYEDLYNIIHDSLNEPRLTLIDKLFNKLNKNKRGNLEIKSIFSAYNGNNEENNDEFKDKILLHHDFYSKEKSDIDYDEFIDFFELISIDYKEDINFENYIKNSFNIFSNEIQNENIENDKKEQTKEFLEYLDILRNVLIKQGANGIIELLRNFRNVDKSKSNNIDLDEFISIIDNLLKNEQNKFTLNEIQFLFNIYDIQEAGIMQYNKFINDLLKLNLMSETRKKHLELIFNHLDYEGKHALDINYLTSLYKEPKENNPLPDLIESFINFHNIIRGNRNPLVTINNFIEFYTYINILIPETKNDQLFIDFTSDSWLLYDKTFDERKNLAILKVESLGKQKNREAMNKLIKSNKTPFGTIKDKINYNLNEANATMKYNVNKIEDILTHLRSILIERGYTGIMSMRRTFMLMDENSNKKISFDDFDKLFKTFRYDLSETEINNLFNYYDKGGNGFINYEQFINELCGNLNQFRKNILKQVFDKLDNEEKGFITVGIIRHEYNPRGNPLVRQGKRCEDEILAEFLDVLEYHFNLLIEKNEDDIDVNEIKVDFEEFCNFYKNISLCIEDDKYFEIMVLSEWGVQKEGKSLYQRTWNKYDA